MVSGTLLIIVLQTVNAKYKVEFHGAIAKVIPSLIKLLEDQDDDVRWETVELIGKLANHGK